MATGNITTFDRRQTDDELALDRAFDVLSHSYRRIVIEKLEQDAPVELAELAERVADRDESVSVRAAKLELAHRHLPKMDDVGVVAYDSTARRCDLDQGATVRSILYAIDDWM